MHSLMDYIWLIIAALLSVMAVPCVKQYIQDGNIIWLVIAIVMNILLIFLYLILFIKYESIQAYSMIKILSIIILIPISIILFSEKINIQIVIGLILGCLALYLLNYH